MTILGWIILGLLAGFIASKIVNKTGEGVILDIVLGIVGAVVGGLLFSALGLRFEILFGPEHGYGGEAQDMATVGDARDAEGTIVRSLYGDQLEDLIPKD